MAREELTDGVAPYEGRWLREPSAVSRGWITTWQLKGLLGDEDDSATVARVARAMHERLERYRMESCGGRWAADEEVAQISDEFHTIGFVDGDASADAEYFNLVLNSLYDWADVQRVVIG